MIYGIFIKFICFYVTVFYSGTTLTVDSTSASSPTRKQSSSWNSKTFNFISKLSQLFQQWFFMQYVMFIKFMCFFVIAFYSQMTHDGRGH